MPPRLVPLPALALLLCASACRRSGPASAGFENVYPRARAEARLTVQGEVGGVAVTVHATAPFDEAAARRFLLGLEDYRREVVSDYALWTAGLERHLGPELMRRLSDWEALRAPPLPTTWYLLGGEWPGAILWRGPPGCAYHIVRHPGDPLVPRSTLRYSVHSLTHGIIRRMGEGEFAVWPRWLEEGFAEWHRLQFARVKDGRWDGDGDVLARLTWQRPAVRDRLLTWKNPHGLAFIDARFEPDWESDLLYKAALGAVLALDQELPGGAVGLFKALAHARPRTLEGVMGIVHAQLGRSLDQVGRASSEARAELGRGLLARARAGDRFALAVVGQLPEEGREVAEVLRGRWPGSDAEGVIAGVTGLRYLGDRRLLERTLKEIEAAAGPDLRASLAGDNRWRMAVEYAGSGRQGAWYANSAPNLHYIGTGPGTGTPSRRPSRSPTR